jgi:hypothetical protein
MTDMSRPRPPFLRREVTRHGTVVWYVRKGESQRVRIRAAFGTPAFDAEYRSALDATPRPVKGGTIAGSIAWLIERYEETSAWTKLSRASQRQRQNMLAQVIKAAGSRSFTEITKSSLESARDRRSAAQGRKFLDVMRALFRWAIKAGIAKIDPTSGVATLRRSRLPASMCRAKTTLPLMRHVGRSGRGSAYGWTCSFIPASGAAMP